jgi:hypothetical protein
MLPKGEAPCVEQLGTRLSFGHPSTSPCSTPPAPPPRPPSCRLARPAADTPFYQQHLRAWRPLVTPAWAVLSLLATAAPLLALGWWARHENAAAVEYRQQYDGPGTDPRYAACALPAGPGAAAGGGSGACTVSFTTDRPLTPPVLLQYELGGFYANHRTYVKSYHADQLRGVVVTDPAKLSSCDPMVTAPDGRVLHPCGLIAQSFFNGACARGVDGCCYRYAHHDVVARGAAVCGCNNQFKLHAYVYARQRVRRHLTSIANVNRPPADTFALASTTAPGGLALDETGIAWEQDRRSYKGVPPSERARYPGVVWITDVFPNVAVSARLRVPVHAQRTHTEG